MVPDSDLTFSINSGMNAMAADYDWPWLFTSENITTVSGTIAYNLPTGHMRTLFVQNVAYGLDLKARQRRDLSRYSVTGQIGFPVWYTVYGASIRFAPTPNAVYTLYHAYTRAEPALTTGSQEPLCPDHFSDIIVLYACAEEAVRQKEFSQHGAFLQDIEAWKRRVRDNIRQEASTLRIRSRGDWSV